jgi:PAS domain S-box-containing protein
MSNGWGSEASDAGDGSPAMIQRQAAAMQVAILDALPAHIALINAEGVILAVNASWRQFAAANGLPGSHFNVGDNYLAVCDGSHGAFADEAPAVALGMRRVLSGEAKEFAIEYPCHSSTEQRWFRMMVTPLHADQREGAVVMHIHVTERVLAEIALRESEERFRVTFEQAAVGIAHVGTNGRFLRVNHKLCKITGYSHDELLRLSFGELSFPEDLAEAYGARQAMLTNEKNDYCTEKRYRRKDGEIVWINLVTTLAREATGEAKYFISVFEDITERKKGEESLRQKDTLIRIAGRVTRTGGWAVEISNQRVFWSDEVFDMLEYPRGNVPPLAEALALYPDPWRGQISTALETCTRDGTPFDLEVEIATAKGRRVCVRVAGEAERDASGTITRVQGAFQDISDSKQSEKKLREQAALLDKAQDAILVRDLEHHILYWNHSAERLYGWTAAEALGRPVEELLYRGSAEFLAATEAALTQGEWLGEIQQFHKDGRTLTVESRLTLVRDDEGHARSILAINTDITARKKMEQQFLRAQRMESIGTLAGGIAHDLNNMLAPIMMSIELLKVQEKDAKRLNILSTIEDSARRGADMVGQVLSFAQGVAGRQLEVQVGHLLREIEKLANETFLKSIRVRCDIPAGLWMVQGDPSQLHQVLLNLCVNARDAMPRGGTLTLSASNLLLDEQYSGMNLEASPGPYVLIQVEDSGSGMPPEVVDRIFEPFYTTKELGKGTGLGLSTTLAIIKSHGGFIRVYSEPGVGTKFSVYLPARDNTGSDAAVSAETELPRGNGELVLVVDDEAAVRQITQKTLEHFGYHVMLASDGAEAAMLYARHKQDIAVVLTDMMMPVMDGATTIQVLMRMNPQVKIIAASGLNANGMVAEAASAGIKDFIPKPYTAETLLKVLQQVLKEMP